VNKEFLERLKELYRKEFGEIEDFELLPLSGSKRRYVRFINKSGDSIVGVYNPNKQENNTYFYFTSVFKKNELKVPELKWKSEDKVYYFIEDLGKQSLFEKIMKDGYTSEVEKLMKEALKHLVHFQFNAGGSIDYEMCFSSKKFGAKQIYSDLLYFKYYFLDMLPIEYHTEDLLSELQSWSEELSSIGPVGFMYRDFQSRNIILNEKNELGFIDFQGGMQGFPGYDLASFLWQARAKVPMALKRKLLNYYYDYLVEYAPGMSTVNEDAFKRDYLKFVLLRILQTLGAYGYLGLIQNKPHFISSIVPALEQLKEYLEEFSTYPNYNELRQTLEKVVKKDIINSFKKTKYPKENVEKLRIKLFSFSYKKGLPKENSEHGGGYVFDCRGILNPGREEAYKTLTGKDDEVQYYLETKTQMPEFLKYVKRSLDISVMNYLDRGFDSLSIAFGCTGGQHRSVYAAEKIKKYLEEEFELSVELVHLEQEEHDYTRR